MNKITIPALLLGVVMIAGAFAFMPVQEASTVHTSAATLTQQSVKVSENSKAQASAAATTYTWTSDAPMTIVGLKGAELAQTDHTTTVFTITQINGVAMNTAAMTYTTQSSAAAAHTFFSNSVGEQIGSIAGVGTSGAGFLLPIEGVTSITMTVVTTAGSVTVTNAYSLIAETAGTITTS